MNDSIVFQLSNPYRRKTMAWSRYEKYKVVTTVGQALQLGASWADLLRYMSSQGHLIVSQASNPKRYGTMAWGRHEKYKIATTVCQV